MGDNSRVLVPNTPLQLEVLAEGKGVHIEVESEQPFRATTLNSWDAHLYWQNTREFVLQLKEAPYNEQ